LYFRDKFNILLHIYNSMEETNSYVLILKYYSSSSKMKSSSIDRLNIFAIS